MRTDRMPVTAPPTPARTLDELAAADPEMHAKVERVRAQMPATPMRERAVEG